MANVPFSPDELVADGFHVGTTSMSFGGPAPKLKTPITPRENINHMLARDGEQMWIPGFTDFMGLESRVNKDHIARAEVIDCGAPLALEEKGGPDMFGIEWVFVPLVGGSMVKPGKPALEDVNDWPNVIQFPDVEAMDWAACKELNAPLNATERAFHVTFQNGFFERLISFMDFEGAAMAIIDEDQKDAIHALFAKLCDLYEAMITKYMECVNIDGVCMHDDWGSQRAPFFSVATCREMVMPYIKRMADFCHSKGLWFEQHSCGKNEPLAECMVEAGVDIWFPQAMNDVDMLIDKYGDKMVFSVAPPVVTEETSDEEVDKLAREFVAKYANKQKPIVLFAFRADPRFTNAVYRYSREAFNEQ